MQFPDKFTLFPPYLGFIVRFKKNFLTNRKIKELFFCKVLFYQLTRPRTEIVDMVSTLLGITADIYFPVWKSNLIHNII